MDGLEIMSQSVVGLEPPVEQEATGIDINLAKRILEDEDLTFSEKSMSVHSRMLEGDKPLRARETTVVQVDFAFAQDSSGPLAIRSYREMGIKRLWDPSKVMIAIDHTYPASDVKIADLHAMIRAFGREQGCLVEEGNISHQFVLENVARPGMMIYGGDSHTCQAGCVGAFATGVGSTEMAAVWASGELWAIVPETVRINLSGRLPNGVYARDIIISHIGEVGEDGGNYLSLEWKGEGVKDLTIDSRACISNASMECGAKNSMFPIDERTKQFLESRGRSPMYVINSGKDAEIRDEHDIELPNLEPVVAGPDLVDKVRTVDGIGNVAIDEAFIGSATNGRIEDLEAAARILKGHRVHRGTRCVVTPASENVFREAMHRGYVDVFLDAGAVFTNATCGACVGTHLGILAENEVCISSSSRNYVGRMGAFSAKIYLASPATVAASAIEGKIADPRRYL